MSLSSMFEVAKQQTAESAVVNRGVSALSHPTANAVVDSEMVQKQWNRYARSVELEKPHLYSLMTSTTISVANFNDIVVNVLNQSQQDELKREDSELIMFLRKELGNSNLRIVCVLNTNNVVKKAYTSYEKFEEMKRQNPNIEKLQRALGLDIE